jgi:hypothetical protein
MIGATFFYTPLSAVTDLNKFEFYINYDNENGKSRII